MAFLQWLESTGYSDWILTSPWGWPIVLSAHVVGLALVVGVMISLNLRLLGLYGSIPYTAVHDLMNLAWIGIAMNIFTGLSLFMAQATMYVQNMPFLVKISFVILGIISLVVLQKTLRREAAAWQAAGAVTQNGRVLAATSLAFWLIAVAAGRLIAYL
jgi:hypothetical protein